MSLDVIVESSAHLAQGLGIKLFGSRQISRGHSLHALRVGSNFHNLLRQRLVIVGRYEVFGGKQLRNTAYVGADARTAACHGFMQGSRKSLGAGGHYKQINRIQKIENLFAELQLTQKVRVIRNRQLAGQQLHRSAVPAFTDEKNFEIETLT